MQIGQWQTIEQIGSGGGGTVYKARDVHSDQIVALKQMNLPPGLEREDLKQRFLREARAMAKINSDYVVRLYASQIIDDNPVLVMEYLPGGTLATEMAKGPFSPEKVVRLLYEALQGLAAVHEAGVVHRDIKPSNLLRADSGRLKIADFGISGQLGSMHTMHVGTVQYAAPEYITDPEHVDGRADLYSLGLAAYEAALSREGFQNALQQHSGVDPYVVSTQWHAWLADPTKEVPPLHLVSPEIPLELSKLISRLVAKDPARRYASSAAALDDLKQLDLAARAHIEGAGTKESERGGGQAPPAPPVTKKTSKPPVALIAGSITVTILIAVAALLLKPSQPEQVASKNAGPARVDPPPPPKNETPPPPPPKVPDKLDTWTAFERLADQTSERLQITNVRSAYGVGDSMSMDVVLPRAGYLNILTISEVTGKATVLFPNDFATDNRFTQAGVVHLPASGARYKFGFALPDAANEERNLLVAFLTAQPVNARALAADAAAFRELTVGEGDVARGAIVADAGYAAGKQSYLLSGRQGTRPGGAEAPPVKGVR